MSIDHPHSGQKTPIEAHLETIWPTLKALLQVLNIPKEIQEGIKFFPEKFCGKKGNPIFAFTQSWHKKPLKLHLHHKNGTTWMSYKDPTKAVTDFKITIFHHTTLGCQCQLHFKWIDADVKVSCNIPHTPEIPWKEGMPITQDEHLLSAITAPEITPQVRALFYKLLDDDLRSTLKGLASQPRTLTS